MKFSVDSGLPDFRGKDGFYRFGGDAIRMDAIDFHRRLAPSCVLPAPPPQPARCRSSPHTQPACPVRARWYACRVMHSLMREKRPHDGYAALLAFLRAHAANYFVLTSGHCCFACCHCLPAWWSSLALLHNPPHRQH